MRILFITNTPPIPSWGGAMTFYRHFCERTDFTIAVITNDIQINKYQVPYRYLLIDHSNSWVRLAKTRLYMVPHTWDKLIGYSPIPHHVLSFATEFKPDAIFTVAGSWSGMALLAKTIARKLKVPLIGSFNDWWYYSSLYHQKAANLIENRFRKFYKECDLAICTSENMRNELGNHPNSIVLYPTGALITEDEQPELDDKPDRAFTVAFGGSLADWYGKMLESLIVAAKGTGIVFKIFGSNPSWTPEFDKYVKETGIYKGLVPFEQLQVEMKSVDGLLLLMGFDDESAMIEKTSFKTKFLDYLTFKKPIVLWGPEYCSAVGIAREFGSAEICTSADVNEFLKTIIKVKEDKVLQKTLTMNAYKMYVERCHPDIIHQKLLKGIQLLKNKKTLKR